MWKKNLPQQLQLEGAVGGRMFTKFNYLTQRMAINSYRSSYKWTLRTTLPIARGDPHLPRHGEQRAKKSHLGSVASYYPHPEAQTL